MANYFPVRGWAGSIGFVAVEPAVIQHLQNRNEIRDDVPWAVRYFTFLYDKDVQLRI
jgi:hypothetical protein